jgi:penicillin-binding protein 1A
MTAYQMVHILEGVVQRGTAQVLRDLGRPLFGKTGTSTGPTNVWFIGGSADIVAGVYMGFDQPRPMGGYAQGGTLAAPNFQAIRQGSVQGHAGGPVPCTGRHPHGAHRPPVRPQGVRYLADR